VIDRLWDYWGANVKARVAAATVALPLPGVSVVRVLGKIFRPGVAKVAVAVLGVLLVFFELKFSWIQSQLFSAAASRASYKVEPGASRSIYFPSRGPFNERLGYSRIPGLVERLEKAGYQTTAQARSSSAFLNLTRLGFFPIYREKNQAGLIIHDRSGHEIFSASYPGRAYETYAEIPPAVVQTLLFIENREILDGHYPYRNPAVEWDRMAKAAVDYSVKKVYAGHSLSGGSTLATQLEKTRYSPGGRTGSAVEKLRQMGSASLRAYLDGPVTIDTRKRIVRDYINSIPLAAQGGYGEVSGLGDGLWAWFGADFGHINRLLAGAAEVNASDPLLAERALAFRQVLSLLLALNQPTNFLIRHPEALQQRAGGYLRLLAEDGIISPELRDAALGVKVRLRGRAPASGAFSFAERKAADSIRFGLLAAFGMKSTYELDRLDLTVRTSLDAAAQQQVTSVLRELSDPARAAEAGLRGEHLLNGAEPGSIIYSFSLYEHRDGVNLLRVQADNFDQPLNINQGTKLELGSTAKLRTLVNYLEVVTRLHGKYSGMRVSELETTPVHPHDRLTEWALNYFVVAEDKSLPAMLEAAMNKKYSASPGEGFFTGGGLHYFSNFDRKDNGRFLTVRESFQRSVNLVFIRLMRDLVNYYKASMPAGVAETLRERNSPARLRYLARFADEEGRVFLARFWQKYAGMNQAEALETLVGGIRPTPARLAVIYRSARANAGVEEFGSFLAAHLPQAKRPSRRTIESLYAEYGPDKFNLADRGYVAGVHPLELWLMEFKGSRPAANWNQAVAASASERQQVYQWLFTTKYPQAQNIRIRVMMESDAFREMHKDWKRQGFPFDSLVPSYATAIGSSGDNPAALAELAGIILNGGVRSPSLRVHDMHFAAGTPFETLLERRSAKGDHVLSPEVVSVVRQEMLGVVERGTARRAFNSFVLPDGTRIPVGGKTGTGDNRYETYARGGRPIASRAVNRTATFVFTIGDRYFGTITAYVPGERAEAYEFTSSLPVQIFKTLAPKIAPVITGRGAS
jgi:membrane peptidoglycan carboxypeptidase